MEAAAISPTTANPARTKEQDTKLELQSTTRWADQNEYGQMQTGAKMIVNRK
jgi:hypothetical protein